ncbi:radical SAM family heme chaperone HemW [Rothia nasimurium]|uniref:radical SAM family heme chaperone HemW n=1 Tax=Rothia nasimurium TaxID=85336 RepID=UPI001F0206A3|nr:radical SAM family heme chaperone HemW [Rothia nasimurium]
MPAQPLGAPAPLDGRIPLDSAVRLLERDFSLYVHVPFCSVRCGYCDFNTYATEDFGNGVGLGTYAEDAIAELRFARQVLRESGAPDRALFSVFFGGGTPTKLPAADLVKILREAVDLFGLEEGAEVTTEANPDSVTREDLETLKAGGFTRVSFGMQSVVPEVLEVLDRTHTPANVPKVVAWAKEVGLQVSVDLIYGSPGESLAQWEQSVRAAVSYAPDHISAYSLIVEEGTKLAAQIRRGDYAMPDEDLMADMYLLAEQIFTEAGYHWYEVSNYARSPEYRSRHNYAYWRNQDWWGIGPGAHSHVDGTRWWNLKHPVPYANRVRAGQSPSAAREVLGEQTRRFEDIMLQVRVIDGLDISHLSQGADENRLTSSLDWLEGQGLIEPEARRDGRVQLTLQGRLLGDAVTRELLPDIDD